MTRTGTGTGTGTRARVRPGAAARPAARALVLAAAAALPLLAAAPAQATGYRYWSFWDGSSGSWTYQQQGPATYRPQDGGVDGWRFAVSPDGGSGAARPRAAAGFAAVCGGTAARAGRKRVAVVLDFGTPADAPAGERPPVRRTACAVVPEDASSAEVLAATVPPLRYDGSAILCAIAGYPRSGCGEAVGAGTADAAGAPAKGGGSGDGGGPSVGLAAGGAVVAAVAAGAVVRARRRRTP
ncbi:SCO2322 family protein [Streptomyces sp. NPDC001380]|uniref:SCO2322 family protein n=1 Tax=Streptomyces sp. NPDC001380 TaxID=3364566 RepID=UPI0036C933B0